MNLFTQLKKIYKFLTKETEEIKKYTLTHIETKSLTYQLHHPLEFEIKTLGNYIMIKNHHLNLMGYGNIEEEAIQSLNYWFSNMYQYYMYTVSHNIPIPEAEIPLREKYIKSVKHLDFK